MIALTLFVIGSMGYAYAYRGQARWAGFGEYVRKGWPLFTPFNCLLYLFTKPKARPAIMDMTQFPELAELQENWQTIREEAIELMAEGGFDKISDKESASYYDIGFRTFYKYGWTKFYLNWYGYTHASALRTCPKTIEILSSSQRRDVFRSTAWRTADTSLRPGGLLVALPSRLGHAK